MLIAVCLLIVFWAAVLAAWSAIVGNWLWMLLLPPIAGTILVMLSLCACAHVEEK